MQRVRERYKGGYKERRKEKGRGGGQNWIEKRAQEKGQARKLRKCSHSNNTLNFTAKQLSVT